MTEKTRMVPFNWIQKPLAIEPKKLDAILASNIDPKALDDLQNIFDSDQKNSFPITDDGIAILDVAGPLVGGNLSFTERLFGLNDKPIA